MPSRREKAEDQVEKVQEPKKKRAKKEKAEEVEEVEAKPKKDNKDDKKGKPKGEKEKVEVVVVQEEVEEVKQEDPKDSKTARTAAARSARWKADVPQALDRAGQKVFYAELGRRKAGTSDKEKDKLFLETWSSCKSLQDRRAFQSSWSIDKDPTPVEYCPYFAATANMWNIVHMFGFN
jgi:hypothetical protein